MLEATLSEYVTRVREYLYSPEGMRNRRSLMQGRGYSYKRFVLESVCYVTRLVKLEHVLAVADRVLSEELSGEAVA
jgi:hypothetical protein